MAEWELHMPGMASKIEKTNELLKREWLVANGLGGYASGTVVGVATRRYHSLLIAALPAPMGRHVMLNHLTEMLRLPDGTTVVLGGEERDDALLEAPGIPSLKSFRLERGLPVWCYEIAGISVEKRVFLPHQQNTVYINYRLVKGDATVRLKLRPAIHFRPHDAPVDNAHYGTYKLSSEDCCYEISVPGSALPPLRLFLYGRHNEFNLENHPKEDLLYSGEHIRGYE
jgi:predicted glycogen debranching enzyme